MTDRTWLGGGNDQASNPDDWSPGGAPAPGDTLSITQGTLNVSGNALAGNTLAVSGFGNSVEINTKHHARLDLATTGSTTSVDVEVHGTLRLTAQVDGFFLENVTLDGGTIKFIGSSTFKGSHTVFHGALTGFATINVEHGSNSAGASELMEFGGPVGRGLTFELEAGGPPVSLQIDNPRTFHGKIDLPADLVGSVSFLGIHATRADLRDDILRMFDGRRLVDTVRVGGTNAALKLEQSSQGVVLSQGSLAPTSGPDIPIHFS